MDSSQVLSILIFIICIAIIASNELLINYERVLKKEHIVLPYIFQLLKAGELKEYTFTPLEMKKYSSIMVREATRKNIFFHDLAIKRGGGGKEMAIKGKILFLVTFFPAIKRRTFFCDFPNFVYYEIV